MHRWFILSSVATFLISSVFANDWPQWRGTSHDGRSTETGLVAKMPKDGPKVAWSFKDCGHGFSAPVIAGNKVVILGASGEIKQGYEEFIMALDEASGKELWRTPITKYQDNTIINGWGHGPRGSAAVEGDHAYALGCLGDLICVDVKTGKEVWRKHLVKDFGGALMHTNGVKQTWGFSESPIVDGNMVLVTPGGEQGTILALDRMTGKTVWQSGDVKQCSTYSSIVPATFDGVKQYVQLARNGLISVDAKTGKLLWSAKVVENGTGMIPTPVVQGNLVYATSAYNSGCACVQVTKSGDNFDAKVLYSNKLMQNHHGGVIHHNGTIFGYSNTDRGKWVCHNMADGKELFAFKGFPMGSVTFADGHFWCYSQDDGTMAVVKASTDKWEQVAQFKIPEGSKVNRRSGKVWTHPVIANGKLYLRDLDLLYCFDLKGS